MNHIKLSAEQKALTVLGAIVLVSAANLVGTFTLNDKVNQLTQVKPVMVDLVTASPSASASPSLTPSPTASVSSRLRK